MISNDRKIERIFESLKQLMEIKHELQKQCKPIDQNLKSWINALTYCLSDTPMILGDPN